VKAGRAPSASAASGTLAATLIGGIAVLLWALLAIFTVWAGAVPPFQLLALCFAIAFLASALLIARKGLGAFRVLRQPPGVWLASTAGLFGYHFFYFMALQNAPAVEASLIAYLWPLLIVLFAALLPGERLGLHHLAGALLGFFGAALLVSGGRFDFKAEFWLGYLCAIACALIWSSYSVGNRRFGTVPTEAVSGFCGAVALLGLLCHLILETSVMPSGGQWLAILGLGLGPVGLAFFVWDYGTKHGSLPVLGALSYAAPLISTVILIALGEAQGSWIVWAACLLIVGGAVLAAKDMLLRR